MKGREAMKCVSNEQTENAALSCEKVPSRITLLLSGRTLSRLCVGSVFALSLAACTTVDGGNKIDATQTTEAPVKAKKTRVSSATGGYYKIGKPYTVRGKTYYPKEDEDYSEVGLASWYGGGFHGGKTANGETYNMMSISAAHKTLPMPSYVRVTNLKNNRSIIVRVNNRGPFVRGRLIDVSKRTAELLDFKQYGVAKVRVDYVGPASIDGSDYKQLAGTLRTDGALAALPGQDSAVQVAEAQLLVPDIPEVVPTSHGEVPVPLARQPDSDFQVQVASAEWMTGAEPVSGLGYAGVPGADTGR